MKGKKMFKITSSKGFHVTFENKLTVSVQWGYGNYCDNFVGLTKNVYKDLGREKDVEELSSPDAEIAIWDENGIWATDIFADTDGMVLGYLTAEEVFEIIEKVRAHKTEVSFNKV